VGRPSYCWYQTSDIDTRHEIVYDKCGIVCEVVDTRSHEVRSNRCSTPLHLQSVCLRLTSIALDRPSLNRSTSSSSSSSFIYPQYNSYKEQGRLNLGGNDTFCVTGNVGRS